MEQSPSAIIDRAPSPENSILEALGLRRRAAGIDRLVKVQSLERAIATLRAENLALRIHVQELERAILDIGADVEGSAPGETVTNGHVA